MRIGEFVKRVKTTKDTVRHYENMELLNPDMVGTRRQYTEKEILEFQVITELKSFGFSLNDIQLIFQLKFAYGCGNQQMVHQLFAQLASHLEVVKKEEIEIKRRRILLEDELKQLEKLL